jgi:hypothetical protein
MKISFSI